MVLVALVLTVPGLARAATVPAGAQKLISGVVTPPTPKTVGPLPVSASSYPWDAAAHGLTPVSLGRSGYVEREYLVKGHANVYSEASGGALGVNATGPYVTRILVRRPADPQRFSGRVIVELNNPTSNYDVDIMWAALHDYLIQRGDAYVGISIKPVVLAAMQKFDPSRYARLSMANPSPSSTCPQGSSTTETGLAWDMISQIGALLKHPGAGNPLAGLHVRDLYLTGYSQSGGYMVTYINDFTPHFSLPGGAPIFDGYLDAAGYGFTELAPINQCAVPAAPGGPGFILRPPGNAPVIDVQTLSDSYSFFGWAGEEPNSNTPADRYQLYQVPGSSHIWAYQVAFTPGGAELTRAGFPANDWQDNCLDPINPVPLQYVMDGAVENLDRWVRRGIAPPAAPHITAAGDGTPGATIVNDQYGNAQGGVRTPYVDVPIATYYGTTPGPGTCTLLWGHWAPFNPAQLATLYPTHAAYVTPVKDEANRLAEEHWLTRQDAALISAEAQRANVP